MRHSIAASPQRVLTRRIQLWGGQVFRYIGLLLLSIPFIFPFWWMLTSSFKPASEIFAFPPQLLPATWRWQNFLEVFTFQPFARHYFNSLYIAVLVTGGTILVASLAGYGFARVRFRGSTPLFLLLLSSLMMPAEVTIIPNFQLMKTLNLTNTHVPLIMIPILGGSVAEMFIMRQFFLSLPGEIEEAALIDGLSRLGIFWYIALPLAAPAIGAVAILAFLGSWNSFLAPLVYLSDRNLFTLPLSLASFTDITGSPVWHLQLAATTLSVLPILLVYVLAQRYIIQSFTLSGVKG